ncbi:MAG: response regulator [Syntrophorhabdaceae bacterium]|nr:response regulator [Syntrophorhabdaceae bacterium]
MQNKNSYNEQPDFKWDFFERAIKNYSVLIRIINIFDKGMSLIQESPTIFLEELPFETCKIVIEGKKNREYSYLSLDKTPDNIELETISEFYSESKSPCLLNDRFGYSLIYIYPLSNIKTEIIGYLIFATKRKWIIPDSFLKELKLLCNIFNKLVLLNIKSEPDYEGHNKEMFYKKALDFFPEPVFILNDTYDIQYANKKAVEVFSIDDQLLLGERFTNIFKIDTHILESSFPIEGKVEFISGGNYNIFKLRSFPLFQDENGRNGKIKCFLLQDVSQEKIEHEYRSQLRNMENLSLLAGGIAHDFNNILTGIMGYASLMKNFLEKESRLLKYTLAIEHAAQRAAKLTHHLLGFAKRQNRKSAIVDINAIIEDLALIFKESYRDITVNKKLTEMLPPVKGNEGDIQNILLNILLNAKDAVEGKGNVTISTGYKEFKNKKGFVFVEIEDNGPGMSKDIINRVFEPFFTTKKDEHRLGMGLYIAKKLTRNNGGIIEIDSKLEKGTKFTVYLPVASTNNYTQSLNDEKDINQEEFNLNIRALIVDDETVIRDFLKGVLKSAGVQVIEAKDGYEAVELFKNHYDTIDIVILDMIMPGKKGDEVLREVRNIKKDVKILISSGFMNEKQKESLKSHHIDGFLDKPYTARELLDTIKNLFRS